MSVNILTPESKFNFDKVIMDQIYPVSGQSGVYFSNIKVDNLEKKKLYLQLEECSSKQGVISNKGTKYIEMKMKRDCNENIIKWFENLEFRCNDILDENKENWFNTELSRDDIEVMMDKTIRLYSSGTFITIKVIVDLSTTDTRSLVFDDNNNLMDIECITHDTTFIPLLMIEGVRCFSKHFEIVVKLVQLMVTNKHVEKHCLIKRDQSNKSNKSNKPSSEQLNTSLPDSLVANGVNNHNISTTAELPKIIPGKSESIDTIPMMATKCSDIMEVDIVVTDIDSMTLKDSDAIYYELYKEALLKAKRLKSEFITAYFNANKIKMAHNLEIDSDEDDDIN